MNDKILQSKIILIEDDRIFLKELQNLLKEAGYQEVVAINSQQDALWKLENYFFDLAVIQGNPQTSNGLSLITQAKQKNADYLVLVPQENTALRLQALKLKVESVLSTPFLPEEFLIYVQKILYQKHKRKKILQKNSDLEFFFQKQTQQLQESRLELIYRLARAAEYRDEHTGYHIARVGEYSFLLGRLSGMAEEQSLDLLHAAHLHDIGKIGVPDDILLKKDILTTKELRIMQRHPVIGADILAGSDSSLLEMAKLISLSHHERWNGSGYPYGLKEKEIPLVGRIVAIADVFDALCSERPYKEAWSTEKALRMLTKRSGNHFDPHLVELFVNSKAEILKIQKFYHKKIQVL